jgi:hypothetical protein
MLGGVGHPLTKLNPLIFARPPPPEDLASSLNRFRT